MAEPTLGTEQLLPYERDGASKTDAGNGDFDDVASAILGDETTEAEDQDTAAEEADGAEAEEVEASDEDEPAEDDQEPDDSDEDPQAPPTYRVRVDGQELEVPLPELLAGYSRQADYTRKTTELSTQRKALEADAVAYRQLRDQYADRIPALEKVLAETMPPEPDEGLRQSNPGEYAARAEERRAHAEKLARVRAEQDGIRAEQEREYHASLTAHLQAEHAKLTEAIPEWKDEAKAKAEKGKLVDFAGTLGWTEDDLSNVTDHRLVLILRDAMRYREGQTKGKQVIQDKAKTAKVLAPGGRPNTTKQPKRSEIERQAERLNKSGRVDDAAKLFENLF